MRMVIRVHLRAPSSEFDSSKSLHVSESRSALGPAGYQFVHVAATCPAATAGCINKHRQVDAAYTTTYALSICTPHCPAGLYFSPLQSEEGARRYETRTRTRVS